jgi:hypothetical protein
MTGRQKEDYLESLKPAAKALRSAYQSDKDRRETVDYSSPEIQAVYLLRYYVVNASMTLQVLRELPLNAMAKGGDEFLAATFLGPGPAPELFGFLRFVKDQLPSVKMAVATLIDRANHAWTPCRQVTTELLIPIIWDRLLFDSQVINYDLTAAGSADQHLATAIRDALASSRFVMHQNLICEIPKCLHERVIDRLVRVIKLMRPGSTFLGIERRGYPEAVEILRTVYRKVVIEQGLADCLLYPEPYTDWIVDCREDLDIMPSILTEHLCIRKDTVADYISPEEDGLILSRRIRYVRLALRRSRQTVP